MRVYKRTTSRNHTYRENALDLSLSLSLGDAADYRDYGERIVGHGNNTICCLTSMPNKCICYVILRMFNCVNGQIICAINGNWSTRYWSALFSTRSIGKTFRGPCGLVTSFLPNYLRKKLSERLNPSKQHMDIEISLKKIELEPFIDVSSNRFPHTHTHAQTHIHTIQNCWW